MAKKTVPSYRRQKRAKGTDSAFVEVDGQRVYLGPYNSPESREHYAQTLTALESGKRNGMRVHNVSSPHTVTISACVAAYWEFAETYYRTHGEPTPEIAKLRSVTPRLVRPWRTSPAGASGLLRLRARRRPCRRADGVAGPAGGELLAWTLGARAQSQLIR